MIDTKKLEGENESQYLWRMGQAKDAGLLDLDWNGIADLMNREFGDPDKPYSEAAYRKPYQMAKKFWEDGVFDAMSEDDYIDKLNDSKYELEKEKIKMRDERNELNRVIREEARKESYEEQIMRDISEHDFVPLDYDKSKYKDTYCKDWGKDNDLIISLTDIHAGIEIDNFCNKFNTDILKARMNKYIAKIKKVVKTHNPENGYVIISELVSGIIHNELRIESNQDLITQFLTVIDLVSQFIAEISYCFNDLHVYMCPGNHSRISPKKEDSLKGENMDHLAIPFLEAKLQNYENIKFHYNEIEESVAMFNVRGLTVMAAHGDKDNIESVVQKFTMMFGIKPDLVYLGHRHTNSMTTVYNTKVIQSGCMSGADNYCMDKRLNGKPEQTISVVNSEGLDCLYDVLLTE